MQKTDHRVLATLNISFSAYSPPSPSGCHLNCDDCLEDKRDDYQNCSRLFTAVLCITAEHSHKQTQNHERFLHVYHGQLV